MMWAASPMCSQPEGQSRTDRTYAPPHCMMWAASPMCSQPEGQSRTDRTLPDSLRFGRQYRYGALPATRQLRQKVDLPDSLRFGRQYRYGALPATRQLRQKVDLPDSLRCHDVPPLPGLGRPSRPHHHQRGDPAKEPPRRPAVARSRAPQPAPSPSTGRPSQRAATTSRRRRTRQFAGSPLPGPAAADCAVGYPALPATYPPIRGIATAGSGCGGLCGRVSGAACDVPANANRSMVAPPLRERGWPAAMRAAVRLSPCEPVHGGSTTPGAWLAGGHARRSPAIAMRTGPWSE